MSTMWGNRHAGSDLAVCEDELGGGSLVIGRVPDWVRTPPELGAQQFRVVRSYERPCPCAGGHSALTLVLEGTER